ncbi:MAG: NADH-quinone oxidoreductase subunit C, partial [Solirubrobacteraceae bacterium]
MSGLGGASGASADSVATLVSGPERTRVRRVDAARLASISHELASEHGARLADLFAEEDADGRILLRSVHALDSESRYVVLECEIAGSRFPSLSDLDPAAFVEECEIYEQYGIRPDNDKRLNRVLMPPHRVDAFPRLTQRHQARLAREYAPHVVNGEAFEFPFGPVRVAGWESLYMGLV